MPGVEPYLKLIQLGPGQTPPPMGVLRWWFTLNYEAITVAKDHRAFAIRGPGVKVLSENERLAAAASGSIRASPMCSTSVGPRALRPISRSWRPSTPFMQNSETSLIWP